MRVAGGEVREAVHPYVIFIPKVSVLSAGTPKRERVIHISRNPRRVVRLCRKEDKLI
jgi:hypothetical protein